MITQHENGDVLEGPENKVIASWSFEWPDQNGLDEPLNITRADFARIVAMANEAEQLKAHLVAVCDTVAAQEGWLDAMKAARAFMAGGGE